MGKKVAELLENFRSKERKSDIVMVHIDSFYVLARCNPGILYLATILRNEGFSVKILSPIDFYCLSIEEIKDFFTYTSPAIIGFYTNSDNIFSVREMSRRIKQWVSEAKIIVGGPLASAQGEEILSWKYFDASICGEGESALVAYARSIIWHQGNLGEVPSLIYRDGSKILKNKRAPLIEDLDEIPAPDYSIAGGSKPQVLSISSGRGCPFGCAFCFQAVHGKKYRYRSPENVVNEITTNLEKYNLSVFSIIDDTFVANPDRARKICELLIEYKERSRRDFAFYCEGRVDIFTRHPDLLPLLKEAGLIRLQIGIESGDQKVIDAYKKGIRLEQVKEIVERLTELEGISLVGNFIVGGAFETEETVEKSLQFAESLIERAPGIFETGIGFFCPYPGTEISKNPDKFDIIVKEPQFKDNLSTLEASCATKSLSIETLRILKQKFFRKIDAIMRKNVSRIPFSRMHNHFQWALKYGLSTFWYSYIKEKQALDKYFFFLASPRFLRLADNPRKDLKYITPMRTISMLHYNDDGHSLLLNGSTRKITLKDAKEIFLYRRSCGKQTLFDIAKEVQLLFFPGEDIDSIIRGKMLPFLMRLEKYYYMNFFE